MSKYNNAEAAFETWWMLQGRHDAFKQQAREAFIAAYQICIMNGENRELKFSRLRKTKVRL